ncbi:Uncharacterised protein [Klebsiella pneumoniae]|uniref:Uncharacterized protein n=1 Tax=Klebsiella pneumoniae TaxID=573 RepID=A0A2X3CI46_KLEPN|nr:Uncharacterised protein [Klebsiella pneumoniae]
MVRVNVGEVDRVDIVDLAAALPERAGNGGPQSINHCCCPHRSPAARRYFAVQEKALPQPSTSIFITLAKIFCRLIKLS